MKKTILYQCLFYFTLFFVFQSPIEFTYFVSKKEVWTIKVKQSTLYQWKELAFISCTYYPSCVCVVCQLFSCFLKRNKSIFSLSSQSNLMEGVRRILAFILFASVIDLENQSPNIKTQVLLLLLGYVFHELDGILHNRSRLKVYILILPDM